MVTIWPTRWRSVAATGIERVRLSSIEPMHISDRLTEVLAGSDVFCRHLHIPLQSGSDWILEQMGRPYTAKEFLATIRRLRQAMPDLAVTTDLMVGFPSETEQHFEESLQVCREAGVRQDPRLPVLPPPRHDLLLGALTRYLPRPHGSALSAHESSLPNCVMRSSASGWVRWLRSSWSEPMTESGSQWVEGTSREYVKVRVPDSPAIAGEIVRVRLLESRGEGALGEAV